jgi:hypothetical protein
MPPRWLCLAIVAFWLATTGWLLWRDLAPQLQSGEPPSYHIDFVEEVKLSGRSLTYWNVFHNDHEVFQATTCVEHIPEGDLYDLIAKLSPRPAGHRHSVSIGPLRPVSMESICRVTREGELRSTTTTIEARVDKSPLIPQSPFDLTVVLTAEVRDRQYFCHLKVKHAFGDDINKDLKPVNVSRHGAVLLPLHPVNRIQGLRPGQTWRVPLFDPFANALGAWESTEDSFLDARVLPRTQTLNHGHREVACLVIEYHGDEIEARTWVREGDGTVLRQEMTKGRDHWVMQREDERK